MNTPSLYIYVWSGTGWNTPPAVLGSSFKWARILWEDLSDLNLAYRQKVVFEKDYASYHFLVIDGYTRVDSYPPP